MFTFSSVDLLNATLRGSGTTSYRTKTTAGFKGRKTTSLTEMTATGQRVVGGIDWRDQDLVVLGKSWDLTELKGRLAGSSSTLRFWSWAGRSYNVDLYGKEWTVVAKQRLIPLVTLHQSVPRIFKPSLPATLQFHAELSETDTIFFLLMMIYSEVRWQDDQVDGPPQSDHSV